MNFEQDSELDIESFNFRPVTKGLGFHNEQKKDVVKTKVLVKEQGDISHPLKNVASLGPISTPQEKQIFISETVFGDVSCSYEKNDREQVVYKRKIVAPSFQFTAWVVDMIIILTAYVGTFVLFSKFSGVSGLEIKSLLYSSENIIIFVTLFSLYYISYFSVLDLAGTIGKSLLGVSVVACNNKNATLKQTTIRALISFISFMALGLPMILDFQGKLSDTKLVED